MNNNAWFVAFGVVSLIFIVAITNISGCSDEDRVDGFPQPELRESRNGVLKTVIEALLSINIVENVDTGEMDSIETPTFEGGLIGPTLRIKPGDTIEFDLINNLPANPENQRMGPSGAFPHDKYSTNFHTHGVVASPRGISDNVLRRMEPGTTNPVKIEIPSEHSCGTFWYHPHKHGAVAFQFFGGMFGFVIIDDKDCGLRQIPEIAAAKEYVMGITAIRTDTDSGQVPFVNQEAIAFSQNPGQGVTFPSLWQYFQNTNLYVTINGVTNPTLHMRPGEVQRWRILNAASGITVVPALEGHRFHVVAQDGLNTDEVKQLGVGEGYVMGAGNRVDVMVKAGEPGTYLLQALEPDDDRSVSVLSGIDPAPRRSRVGRDFPSPTYPLTLATIVVSGDPKDMDLPSGALPEPRGLPSKEEMLNADITRSRNLAMELCAPGTQDVLNEGVNGVCEYYFDRYDSDYWGGDFFHVMMVRDADDIGTPNPGEGPPFLYDKEGLFTPGTPLFTGDDAMVAGTFEQWTVYNRSNSDHPFHIHQNPFLVTHINGVELENPEWRDTMLVPAADTSGGGNLVDNQGSIRYVTWFNPLTYGDYVMHCHILTHEDIGMMQEVRLEPEP